MKTRFLYSVKNIILTIPIVISLFSCCSKIFSDEELTLPRQEYTGDELRIDGYYYHYMYSRNGIEYYTTYVLYKNGIVRYGGVITDLNNLNENILNGAKKDHWGIFVINSSEIKIETWYPPNVMQGYPVYLKEGVILNDSTFKITRLYKNGESVNENRDDLYHFKQFSPKPDSTNNFIK